MSSNKDTNNQKPVPTRPHGAIFDNNNSRLPKRVPILGLGCSSFSTFFWTNEELQKEQQSSNNWTAGQLDKNHPRVQEWISTIRYAIEDCGITLLDTAPWYGHGTSEVVIGWAMEEILLSGGVDFRSKLVINTKIGRYEADPKKQFDFGKEATLASAQRSLERMKCHYIDVLQLHDPEFAPSLEQLMTETIPALLECRRRGYCRTLGITGYPLKVQHQILQRSLELDANSGRIWDQSLTYGHYNLVDTSLLDQPIANPQQSTTSFAEYCRQNNVGIMAAAPLNMGLFAPSSPLAEWHPAHQELQEACQKATAICAEHEVDIATLAIAFAMSNPKIPCTIVGMKNVAEVNYSYVVASRFHKLKEDTKNQDDILKAILEDAEYKAFVKVRDPVKGPFAQLWKNGNFAWDGVAEASKFWEKLEGQDQVDWHAK